MATRFPNSYAAFEGMDAHLKYSTTRDANARAEIAAEDARKKAMQDLLTAQATEERAASTYSAGAAARKLAEMTASSGLESLNASLPTLNAERDLSNKIRDAATNRGNTGFDANQEVITKQENLTRSAKDIALKQIAVEQDLIAKFPDLTNPGLRKQLANLLALNTPPETIKALFPQFTPYLDSATTPAAAAAGLPNPVATAQTSVTNAQALAKELGILAIRSDSTNAVAKTAADAKTSAATTAADAKVTAAAIKAAGSPAITGSTAGRAMTSLNPTATTVAPATAAQTAIPTATAPATAPTKAQAAPAQQQPAMPSVVPTDTIDELRVARAQLLRVPQAPGFAEKLKALDSAIAGRETLIAAEDDLKTTNQRIAQLEAIRTRKTQPGTNAAVWTASTDKRELDALYAARERLLPKK
jgi:hypothetical protein